ncbi:MAG TPA: hypothetical protein VNS19_19720 [Acidimicrobiales bacterium]|nr:hypothetical protein [Acidimicrobiales bacterium]
MTRSTHRTIFGAVAVSLALLVSACGTSGGSEADPDEKTTTTEAPDEATTTTAAEDDGGDEAAAQERADSIDLDTSDFPDGWEGTPADDPDEESPLNDCDPALGDRSTQLARHATDDFSIGSFEDGDGTQFTARTVVFEDEAAAEAAVAPFSDPDVLSCIDETLKSAYSSTGEGVTVEGELEVGDAEFDVDETLTLSATYTVSAPDGSSLDINLGVLVLRTGDIATNVVVQTVDPDFDVSSLPIDTLVEQLNAA